MTRSFQTAVLLILFYGRPGLGIRWTRSGLMGRAFAKSPLPCQALLMAPTTLGRGHVGHGRRSSVWPIEPDIFDNSQQRRSLGFRRLNWTSLPGPTTLADAVGTAAVDDMLVGPCSSSSSSIITIKITHAHTRTHGHHLLRYACRPATAQARAHVRRARGRAQWQHLPHRHRANER